MTKRMRWPPPKAWTSTKAILGFRHFVAINYGGEEDQRWLNLVAVLDGKARLRVVWKELKDTTLWNAGWQKLSRADVYQTKDDFISTEEKGFNHKYICLHPSLDSGLIIPSRCRTVRDWT